MRQLIRQRMPELVVVAVVLLLLGGVVVRQQVERVHERAGTHSIGFDQLRPGMLLELHAPGIPRAVLLKVLATDDTGVHVRTYAAADSARTAPGRRSVIAGHVPLSRAAWKLTTAELVGDEQVTERELEGYRLWQTSPGHFFDDFEVAGPMMADRLDLGS